MEPSQKNSESVKNEKRNDNMKELFIKYPADNGFWGIFQSKPKSGDLLDKVRAHIQVHNGQVESAIAQFRYVEELQRIGHQVGLDDRVQKEVVGVLTEQKQKLEIMLKTVSLHLQHSKKTGIQIAEPDTQLPEALSEKWNRCQKEIEKAINQAQNPSQTQH